MGLSITVGNGTEYLHLGSRVEMVELQNPFTYNNVYLSLSGLSCGYSDFLPGYLNSRLNIPHFGHVHMGFGASVHITKEHADAAQQELTHADSPTQRELALVKSYDKYLCGDASADFEERRAQEKAYDTYRRYEVKVWCAFWFDYAWREFEYPALTIS